ncbi:MAG: hypothetical protein AB1458_11940, partial [Bacteroidota bacterium]
MNKFVLFLFLVIIVSSCTDKPDVYNARRFTFTKKKIKPLLFNDSLFFQFLRCVATTEKAELIYKSQRRVEKDESTYWIDTVYVHIQDKKTILTIIDTFPLLVYVKGPIQQVNFLPYANLIFKCNGQETLTFMWNNFSR